MTQTQQPLAQLLLWAPSLEIVVFLARYLSFPVITASRGSISSAECSLLHFSRTCRLVYAAMTNDPRCWANQTLVFDLLEPILHPLDFIQLPSNDNSYSKRLRRVVRVDRFTARQQETMRRLIGGSAFEQIIAPTLLHTQLATVTPEHFYDLEDDFYPQEEMLARTRAEAELGSSVQVYPQLHAAVFGEKEVKPRRQAFIAAAEEHDPYDYSCLWIWGCYCFLLLPSTVRFIPAARVSFQMAYHRDPELQLDCLYRLLDRLPALTSLQLEQPNVVDEELEGPMFSWPFVHQLLPALRHLAIRSVAMDWDKTLHPLLTLDGSSLCALEIETARSFVVSEYEDMHWDDGRMRFCWPSLNESDRELSFSLASTVSPSEARRLNLLLRLALCCHVTNHLRDLIARVPDSERLSGNLKDCEAIEWSLSAGILASGQGTKRPRETS